MGNYTISVVDDRATVHDEGEFITFTLDARGRAVRVARSKNYFDLFKFRKEVMVQHQEMAEKALREKLRT